MQIETLLLSCLTVSLKTHTIAIEPGRTVGSTLDAMGTVSLLAQTTSLAAGTGQTAHLTVLVTHNPVDARVIADLLVAGVDEDDFVVLLGSILVDPVRVEDTEVGVTASDLFFSDALQVAFEFKVVDTLVPNKKVSKTVLMALSVGERTWVYRKPYHGDSDACGLHDGHQHAR